MLIKGTESTSRQITVEVKLLDIADDLMSQVMRHNGLSLGQYVSKTGSIVHEEEQHTSHSYYTEELDIKTPTARQLEVLATVTAFKKLVGEMALEQSKRTWP